jgi:hypothetical protein
VLVLNCWALGDDPSHVFPVEIASNKTVGALKKAIKDENPESFRGIDARSLILHKVSIPNTRQLESSIAGEYLDKRESLSALDGLSEIFSEGLIQKHVHVIVHAGVCYLFHATLIS